MRVVVTGSEGFIGAHTAQAFAARGDMVVTADKRTGTDLSLPIEFWNPRPDVIVHLAASCSTPGSLRDPIGTFTDTVLTAVNVLESARIQEIPVILTSSVKARDGMTPYGAAKRMCELWAQEYQAGYHLPVVINRPGTVYGPGQEGSPESGWIAWFLKARDDGLAITINGDGTQIRDLLHVADYVGLLLQQADELMAGNSWPTEQIWDVGGGWPNAVMVKEMAVHLGLDYSFGPWRYGDALEYVGTNDYPGWTPMIRWRETL